MKILYLKEKYGDWALVTGASSGIGRSFTEILAKEGINIICISNEDASQKAICAELTSKYQIQAIPCIVDLSKETFFDELDHICSEKDIGILVCCASFGYIGPFEKNNLEKYTDLIHVSVYSYFRLVYEFYPKMLQRDKSAIILTSSVNVASPLGMGALYTSSKAFEFYLGMGLQYEVKDKKNMDILVLLPGATKTNFQKVAGTNTVKWAMEPDKVALKALKKLGKKWVVITGWRNRLFQCILSILPIKQRILFGSKTLSKNLMKKTG